ncbi:MAG: hypothetical protein ABFC85_11505 [Rectinema sp.]
MPPMRLPISEDHEPAGRCMSCDRWDALDNLVELDGELYHEDSAKTPSGFICRSGILKCAWCGLGIEQGEAEQDGKDYYHADCLFRSKMQ